MTTDLQDEFPYRRIPDLIREHAAARPERLALVQGAASLSYAALDILMDR